MNVADCAGVVGVDAAGGCHVLCNALEMSLQYGVTGRGAAASRLVLEQVEQLRRVDLLQGGVLVARRAGRHVAGQLGVHALVLGVVMHSTACIASSRCVEYSLTPMPMPPYGGSDSLPCDRLRVAGEAEVLLDARAGSSS